ncbi:MAG: reverse transcriptase family protein, partial [bacterium]
MADLTGYTGDYPPFEIRIKDETKAPAYQRRRPLSLIEKQIQNEKCSELLAANIIAECPEVRYACNPTCPGKKDADGNYTERRLAFDFRDLNAITLTERTLLPRAEEIFESVGKCSFFCKIDFRNGFHQALVAPQDQFKTGFWWGEKTFFYRRLPFGVTMGPSYFHKLISYELQQAGVQESTKSFIDDVLVYNEDADQGIDDVCTVLDR